MGMAGICALPAAPLILAPTAASERVSEDDPQARALHYRHDGSDVDHERHEEGQKCANCGLFTDVDAADWGPCEVFGGRHVATGGWCSAWVPRG
jgi:hypothetical protein